MAVVATPGLSVSWLGKQGAGLQVPFTTHCPSTQVAVTAAEPPAEDTNCGALHDMEQEGAPLLVGATQSLLVPFPRIGRAAQGEGLHEPTGPKTPLTQYMSAPGEYPVLHVYAQEAREAVLPVQIDCVLEMLGGGHGDSVQPVAEAVHTPPEHEAEGFPV